MTLTVQKWGDSLAIRIPANIADENALHEGTVVHYSKSNGKLVFDLDEEALTLDDLVSAITPENLHDATDWGAPVGKEEW